MGGTELQWILVKPPGGKAVTDPPACQEMGMQSKVGGSPEQLGENSGCGPGTMEAGWAKSEWEYGLLHVHSRSRNRSMNEEHLK